MVIACSSWPPRFLDGLRAGRLDPQSVCRARSTDNAVLGHGFPASWYQSLPPLFIILFAPRLPPSGCGWAGETRPVRPSSRSRSLLLGLGFRRDDRAAGAAAARRASEPALAGPFLSAADAGGAVPQPGGTECDECLAPARIAGLVMGVWFLALSVGNYLAGMAASVYETIAAHDLVHDCDRHGSRHGTRTHAIDQAYKKNDGSVLATDPVCR